MRFTCRAFSQYIACWLLIAFGTASCQSSSSAAEQVEVVGRPEDCSLLEQRICAHASDQAPVCNAAKLLLRVTTDASCAENLKNFVVVQQRHAELREPCNELAEEVCGQVGPESDLCGMVREQVIPIAPEECASLLGKSKQLVENLKMQDIARKPLNAENRAKIESGDGPGFGPKDAKVVLVAFSDFQCPRCASAAQVAHQIRELYGDRVRYLFRQFPLPNHEHAVLAAEAALVAAEQGKFWPYHDRLFENQRKLDRDSLEVHAKAVRLDLTQFRKSLDERTYRSAILGDKILAAMVAVESTPTLFINGTRVDPAHWPTVRDTIEEALASSGGS